MMSNFTHRPDLAELRIHVDQLDRKLVELLNERAKLSLAVGEWKLRNNKPVFAAERERELLVTRLEWNREMGETMPPEHIEDIFMAIVASSRAMQHIARQNGLPDYAEGAGDSLPSGSGGEQA